MSEYGPSEELVRKKLVEMGSFGCVWHPPVILFIHFVDFNFGHSRRRQKFESRSLHRQNLISRHPLSFDRPTASQRLVTAATLHSRMQIVQDYSRAIGTQQGRRRDNEVRRALLLTPSINHSRTLLNRSVEHLATGPHDATHVLLTIVAQR